MALKVTMFSDFICPFCYIGFDVMRKLAPEFGIELEWRGFQIHPDWPAEGIAVDKVRSAADLDARKGAWQRITAMADAEGLAMKAPAVLTNSRAALMVAELAKDQGRGLEFEERVYRAYFGEGANIGDGALLARLAGEAGLDPAEAAAAMTSARYDLRLKNASLAAHQRGVSGVPTFFIGEFPLVGAQPSETMRQILRRASDRLAAGR
jgi:predicted DsbA family dithiol-disulfide isomerase